MGLPIDHLCSTNVNDAVPAFLKGHLSTSQYHSNHFKCKDVGDPSNFVRIKDLWKRLKIYVITSVVIALRMMKPMRL